MAISRQSHYRLIREQFPDSPNVLDVLNLSDSGNTLKVTGNAGDRVAGLKHGWEDGGIHGNFHTYTNDAAVLLVGVNVTTDFPMA